MWPWGFVRFFGTGAGRCGSEAIARAKELAGRLGVENTIEKIIVKNEEQAKALVGLQSGLAH